MCRFTAGSLTRVNSDWGRFCSFYRQTDRHGEADRRFLWVANFRCERTGSLSILRTFRFAYFSMCVLLAACLISLYTGCRQKNGAVSKVNNKFISRLTLAQPTPSAAATVPVSHALITVLRCVHPGSHDTHPHGNQIHTRVGVACPL